MLNFIRKTLLTAYSTLVALSPFYQEPISTPEITIQVEEATQSALVEKSIPLPIQNTPDPTTIPVITSSIPNPSLAPKSTIDPFIVSDCESASIPFEIFAGDACVATNEELFSLYQNYTPQSHIDKAFIESNGDLKGRVLAQCQKIGDKIRFESCNNSIRNNWNRLRQQVEQKFETELNQCYSHISEGDGKTKDISKGYFVKNKLKNQIEALYTHCNINNDSVDSFNL